MMKYAFLVLAVLGVMLVGCDAADSQDPQADEPQCPGEAPSPDHFCLDGEWVPLPDGPEELS